MEMMTLNGNGARMKAPAAVPPAEPPRAAEPLRCAPVVAAPAAGPARHATATLRALAFRAIELDRLDDAGLVMEHAAAQAPQDPDLLADLAALALRDGDHDTAVRLAREVIVLRPAHLMGHFALAFGLLAAQRVEEGLPALRALADGELGEALRREQPALADLVAAELARRAGGGVAPTGPVQERLLPLAARFDILVKLLYVLHRRGQLPAWVNVDVPALYARHIHLRTGGVEPGDPLRKPTLQAYVEQFDALIDHMAAHGFDTAHPVQLSAADGLPCDGAHRMATAMALGVPAAVQTVDLPGWRWDLPWFRQHGFSHDECNVLLHAWARLRGDEASVAVLWSPVESDWPALEAALGAQATVVGARTVELPREGFEEMVRDVYSLDGGPRVGPAIENKIRLLRGHPPRVRVVWLERQAGRTPPAAQLKRELRERFDASVPAAWFVTLHLSDSKAELMHLMGIFASEHNLACLRRRRALPEAFVQRLADLGAALARHGLDANDACVVGGSVLAALGLRDSDDIDITLRTEARMRQFDAGITVLAPGVDLVTQQYARSFSATPALDDDQLIASPAAHFRVRGYRFAAAEVVRTRKQHQRRDKDLRDLPLLATFDGPSS